MAFDISRIPEFNEEEDPAPMEPMDTTGMIKLTGLWKQTKPNGEEYLSGKMNRGAKLLVLPNRNKRGPKDPDYDLFVASSAPR